MPNTESEQSTANEGLKEKPLVLCLCNGNVFRSQWAEYLLQLYGIDAISAAVGDVSKQNYQGEVPPHILALMRRHGFDGALQGNRIKQVTEEMVACATHILAFCSSDDLSGYSFVHVDDGRWHFIKVTDPFEDIDAYDQTIYAIYREVTHFCEENF